MRVVLAFLVLFAFQAGADQAWLSNLAFGPSVPQNDAPNHILPQNTSYDSGGQPTRYSGGERIGVHFMDSTGKTDAPLPIESIRLIGFSKSGTGAVLVRGISAKPALDPHFFDPLVLFTAIGADSKAQGKEGHVLLGAGDEVFLQFTQLIDFNDLNLTFESYGSDDASVVVQFIWHGDNPKTTQKITRRIVNPPVSHGGGGGGGWSGGGSSSSNRCSSTMQCNGMQHCINGECVDKSHQACSSGFYSCVPGESCCSGVCQTGSCH